MKKFALGIVLGASLVSTAAVAAEQRPTYLTFKAPVAQTSASVVSPAAPRVKKRNEGFGTIPLFVPLVGLVTLAGLIAGFSTGHDGSPG